MSSFIKIAGFSLLAALTAFCFRRAGKEFSLLILLFAGLSLLIFSLSYLQKIVDVLKNLILQSQAENFSFSFLFKMLFLTLLTEISVQLCRDAGAESLGEKAAFTGKMMLLAETLPILTEIFQMLLNMIP